MLGLWWTRQHWGRTFSENFGFLLSSNIPQLCHVYSFIISSRYKETHTRTQFPNTLCYHTSANKTKVRTRSSVNDRSPIFLLSNTDSVENKRLYQFFVAAGMYFPSCCLATIGDKQTDP
jgi:hypothetical protein